MLILKYTSESELYMETTLPIYENGDKHRTSILYNIQAKLYALCIFQHYNTRILDELGVGSDSSCSIIGKKESHFLL